MTDREFVLSHVDYRLDPGERKLTDQQERHLYYLADGFGKRCREELDRINGGYDWSHYRDSSPAAFHAMALRIREWLSEEDATWRREQQIAEATRQLRGSLQKFWMNPSAENFLLAQRAMLAYQDAMKNTDRD